MSSKVEIYELVRQGNWLTCVKNKYYEVSNSQLPSQISYQSLINASYQVKLIVVLNCSNKPVFVSKVQFATTRRNNPNKVEIIS
jgi:hypothetical protein